jgi:cell division protein FtsQ
VARGERPGTGSRLRARAETAVVPFPRSGRGGRLELHRLAPSGRSLAVCATLIALAGCGWLVARTTSLFAVDTVVVSGAPPAVAREVDAAVAEARGRSLLAVDVERLRARVEAVPSVASAEFDRAFPHTLAVRVVPERPVAVLRQGADSWLASARGRVMGTLERGARPALPRVWLGQSVAIRVGGLLSGDPAAAVRAVAPLADRTLPVRVASVRATADELTLTLRSGVEVRLGDGSQLPFKLAVTARILPSLGEDDAYLDVAVPKRPVAGPSLDSQVEGETQPSTQP